MLLKNWQNHQQSKILVAITESETIRKVKQQLLPITQNVIHNTADSTLLSPCQLQTRI